MSGMKYADRFLQVLTVNPVLSNSSNTLNAFRKKNLDILWNKNKTPLKKASNIWNERENVVIYTYWTFIHPSRRTNFCHLWKRDEDENHHVKLTKPESKRKKITYAFYYAEYGF